MKLHEYQTKAYFQREGIPIPKSGLANTPAEARQIAGDLGYPVVLKAQVLVGGRGKAGGIRLVKNTSETEAVSSQILNSKIKDISVQRLLVEQAIPYQQELYLGITYERLSAQPIMILSAAGGIEIESVAAETPDRIHITHIDPLLGLQDYAIRAAASAIGLDFPYWKPLQQITQALWGLYQKLDATLVEINPLVTTADHHLIALDGKMSIDDNALVRQRDFVGLEDQYIESPTEIEARKFCLNYIQLTGNIGCMVNGAGLAMATMDCIQEAGGQPANFLDIGGGASAEKVSAALSIILSDSKVKSLLINIFGGITRCDEVAKGLVRVLPEVAGRVPVIIRLEGTNAAEGREILRAFPDLIVADSLMGAAKLAVQAIESVSR